MADQGRTIRLPVHLVEQVNKLSRLKRELHQQLGRDATMAELADESGIPEEKIADLLDHARDPVSLDMPVGSDEEAPLGDFIEDSESTSAESAVVVGFMHDDINKVLRTLDEREQTVVRLRYGLDDGRPRTLDEIGRVFGISRERVRQIERELDGEVARRRAVGGPAGLRQLIDRHTRDSSAPWRCGHVTCAACRRQPPRPAPSPRDGAAVVSATALRAAGRRVARAA